MAILLSSIISRFYTSLTSSSVISRAYTSLTPSSVISRSYTSLIPPSSLSSFSYFRIRPRPQQHCFRGFATRHTASSLNDSDGFAKLRYPLEIEVKDSAGFGKRYTIDGPPNVSDYDSDGFTFEIKDSDGGFRFTLGLYSTPKPDPVPAEVYMKLGHLGTTTLDPLPPAPPCPLKFYGLPLGTVTFDPDDPDLEGYDIEQLVSYARDCPNTFLSFSEGLTYTNHPHVTGWEDYDHWFVCMEEPDGDPTRDEIIDSYIKTLAMVVGSEEEARTKKYSVSTRIYYAFGALVSKEVSKKIEGLTGVWFVCPDSYMDDKNKDYGGKLFINGQAVPYDPKYHRAWREKIWRTKIYIKF